MVNGKEGIHGHSAELQSDTVFSRLIRERQELPGASKRRLCASIPQKTGELTMKRKTAKEILAESFRELAEAKSIDKITVKDIVANCGYSQATFYRQFKDKYDLIAWDYVQSVASVMNRVGQNGYPWKQTLIDGAQNFHDSRNYLSNLLKHTEGHESFIRYMSEINFEALKQHIQKANGAEPLSEMLVKIGRAL